MKRAAPIAALALGAALLVAAQTGVFGHRPAVTAEESSAQPAGPVPSATDFGAERLALSREEADLAHRAHLLPENARTLLPVNRTLRHGDFVWNDAGVAAGPITVWVDLRRQLISVFRGGHEIGTAVMVYGAVDKETPLGRFDILSKHRDYHSRTYDSPMPFAMFLTDDGVALHGSRMSARRATHGCVGLPHEFARRLFEAARVGDSVTIVQSEALPAGRLRRGA